MFLMFTSRFVLLTLLPIIHHPSCAATTLCQKKSCAFAARCVASTAQSMIVCVDAWVAVERYKEKEAFLHSTLETILPLGLFCRVPVSTRILLLPFFMFVQHMLLS
jgi:hypothetical protein